ncbi:unnamed protein product, partial [Didymodactylos carnosus]
MCDERLDDPSPPASRDPSPPASRDPSPPPPVPPRSPKTQNLAPTRENSLTTSTPGNITVVPQPGIETRENKTQSAVDVNNVFTTELQKGEIAITSPSKES